MLVLFIIIQLFLQLLIIVISIKSYRIQYCNSFKNI